MKRELTTILSIAGSDCTGGAGIQADIRAAAANGVFTMTAVTAVTAQNSHGVSAVYPVPPSILEAQLNDILEDVRPDAIKIGMLGSCENGETIARVLKNYRGIPVVIDPVMSSSAGGDLNSSTGQILELYLSKLFPIATVVTPNLIESELFLKQTTAKGGADSIEEFAGSLLRLFRSEAVVLKGGHSSGDILTDTLAYRSESGIVRFKTFCSRRISCKNLHGTGCVYSSLLASELAKGRDLSRAFTNASAMIKEFISDSTGYDFGSSDYGPLNTNDYSTKHIQI